VNATTGRAAIEGLLGSTLGLMRPLALGALLGLALIGALAPGCSITPAEREASLAAWAARDAERAAECRRNGLGFAAGGCLSRGL
jgi:hypothetical protein